MHACVHACLPRLACLALPLARLKSLAHLAVASRPACICAARACVTHVCVRYACVRACACGGPAGRVACPRQLDTPHLASAPRGASLSPGASSSLTPRVACARRARAACLAERALRALCVAAPRRAVHCLLFLPKGRTSGAPRRGAEEGLKFRCLAVIKLRGFTTN